MCSAPRYCQSCKLRVAPAKQQAFLQAWRGQFFLVSYLSCGWLYHAQLGRRQNGGKVGVALKLQ